MRRMVLILGLAAALPLGGCLSPSVTMKMDPEIEKRIDNLEQRVDTLERRMGPAKPPGP